MNDLRFAVRRLLKDPGFTAIVVLTLALGIGANTMVFSAIHGLLFCVGPFPEIDRLVRLYSVQRQERRDPHSVANFYDYQQQNRVFSHLAAFYWSSLSLAGDNQLPERVSSLSVTADFFSVLGVVPMLGRTLQAADDQPGHERVVVISYGLWQRRFGGNTNILGQAIRADGKSLVIVGILPAHYEFRRLWGPIEAWTPAAFGAEEKRDRSHNYLAVIARLKPSATIQQAQADLSMIAQRLAQQYPQDDAGNQVRVLSLIESASDAIAWSVSYFLLVITGFVLLIACVNVANLLLARATTREHEVAIRAALGARPSHLVRHLLAESMLYAALGGGLGVGLASWGTHFFGARLLIGYVPGVEISLDQTVLGYALGLAILTGLICGLVPAWQASRPDLNRTLKEAGRSAPVSRSQTRWRGLLVVAEVALALVLLTGSGLFIRGMNRFLRLDPGFRTDHLLTLQLGLTDAKYTNATQRIAFYRQAFERLRALPSVQGVGAVTSLPISGIGPYGRFSIEGRPMSTSKQLPIANWDMVTPQFFTVLGLAVKQGRLLSDADHETAPSVAVINETMAQRFWAGESPVGKRISRGDPNLNDWVEIVGVVRDVRYAANYEHSEARPQIYESLWQRPRGGTAVVLRTTVKPESLVEDVRRAMASIDRELPISDVISFERIVGREMANLQLATQFLGGFAVLGLVLAGIGIYGILSYSVAQRTNEFGLRLALGARPADLLGLVVRQGMGLVFAGTVSGLLGAFLLSLAIRGLLYGISAFDPATFGGVLLVLVGAALLACYVPARRAARVDPLEALRYE